MELIKTREVIEPIVDILEHIKGVQEDMITLSVKANNAFFELIKGAGLDMDERATAAIQYQDIFSQQLSAVVEAINSVTAQMATLTTMQDEALLERQVAELRQMLDESLEEARRKKKAFMGGAMSEETGVTEFF